MHEFMAKTKSKYESASNEITDLQKEHIEEKEDLMI